MPHVGEWTRCLSLQTTSACAKEKQARLSMAACVSKLQTDHWYSWWPAMVCSFTNCHATTSLDLYVGHRNMCSRRLVKNGFHLWIEFSLFEVCSSSWLLMSCGIWQILPRSFLHTLVPSTRLDILKLLKSVFSHSCDKWLTSNKGQYISHGLSKYTPVLLQCSLMSMDLWWAAYGKTMTANSTPNSICLNYHSTLPKA